MEKIEASADDSRLRVEQGISRIFDDGFAILVNSDSASDFKLIKRKSKNLLKLPII